VHPVAGREPFQGGVGIIGDTIEAVGPDSEIRSRCRQTTTVLEASGGEIVPGFCDAHTHPFWQGLQLRSLDLEEATSLKDLLRRVAKAADEASSGLWILGFGWDESGWPDRALPGREALDEASPDRPVCLGRVCGHLAAVNTAALKAVDLEETGGLETADGKPTGRIFGASLAEFFSKIPLSDHERRLALEAFAHACDQSGVTSVHAFVETAVELEALASSPDGPSIWAYGVHRPERPFPFKEAQKLIPPESLLRLVGVKLYADGSIGSHTAFLSRPYDDKPDTVGRLALSFRDMKELIAGFHDDGAQVAVHAIGDAAVEDAVSAVTAALSEGAEPPLPPRLEHLEVIHPLQLHRLVRLGLVASLQPNFIARWGQPSGLYERRLGARFLRMNPLKAFAHQGGTVCFGSDGMPFGPLYGLEAAGLHPDEDQRLSPREALRFYTLGGAEAVGQTDRGSITAGQRADLAVLSPGTLEKPLQGNVLATVRGGRLVWQA
jgi:predicted amidohydrolase YtcJ